MNDTEDLRTAIRHLMEHRTVLADNPRRPEDREVFAIIRRNLTALRRWFTEHPRYDVVVEAEWAHLVKVPFASDGAPSDLAVPRTGRPFDRRRYVWLCLALAAIDRLDERHTRLGSLAEEIEALALQEGLRAPNLDLQGDRGCIADVFRYLEAEGVVRLRDGDVQSFVDAPDGDVVYEVDRTLASRLLAARRPPSLCSSPEDLRQEIYPDGRDGELLRIRHTLWRRLLETPVVYYDTLSDAERQYLDGQRPLFARELRERCGLILEVREEGVAAVEPDVRDGAFPPVPYGSLAVAVAALHRRLSDIDVSTPAQPVPAAQLREALAPVIADSRTSRAYRDDGGDALLHDTLALLERASLVRISSDGVLPLAALRRYAFLVADRGALEAPVASPPAELLIS
ncbi:MAG TPA: TIGR02678 family protein [Candidatus Dormibacteraeota bacterium]|nr:TIGR02678 family protein [Candidatus Dormibacteraeota bacterium]